jgi:hypothetical protein
MPNLPFAGNPFLYHPRWSSLDVSQGVTDEIKYILEERDRELEDYLGSLGSSGGTASALRRTSNQVFNSGLAVIVNFSTTDYLSGMTAASGQLTVVTAGIWSITTSVAFHVDAASSPLAVEIVAGGQIVQSGQRPVPANGDGFECLTFDVNLAVGNTVYAAMFETSGAGVVKGTVVATAGNPVRLSAHLVG